MLVLVSGFVIVIMIVIVIVICLNNILYSAGGTYDVTLLPARPADIVWCTRQDFIGCTSERPTSHKDKDYKISRSVPLDVRYIL